MSGSQIKGGGRAIMSEESQQALINLLMELDKDGKAEEKELSAHDKKRQQKKFMKRLVHKFEQRQLQQRYNATLCHNSDKNSGKNKQLAATQPKLPTNKSNPNVRIELVEAIFPKNSSDSKKDTKKKNSSKKSNKFKVGARKVIVLGRTTTIPELLKTSKQKLKLKKQVLRAFIEDERAVFDLDTDLSALEDGAQVFVTVSSPSPTLEKEVDDMNNKDDENTNDTSIVIDPLESVKRAYQRQEEHKQLKQLPRVKEVIDMNKQQSLQDIRASLPVASHKSRLLETIHEHQVVVLSGATGSGKSTQLPQYILDGCIDSPSSKKKPYIVVTQPRKVAAISLAYRVAEERGCPMPGVLGGSVGYMVRSDRRVCLQSCRIIYMTIGILLRMLVNKGKDESNSTGEDDSIVPPLSIDTISHLIIDETHERDVNTDFVLTLLKGMLSSSHTKNSIPKMVLMSATASSDLFISYFSTSTITPVAIEVPGRTFPVECNWLADCEKFCGQQNTSLSTNKNAKNERSRSSGNTNIVELSPRTTEQIDYKFLRALIVKIIEEQQSNGSLYDDTNGAILVFLPGVGEIESLARCLYEQGTVVSNRVRCKIMKLHSSVPKSEQRQVFTPAIVGTVKVVLATNIAETSVTIPDIVHVIDTCRVKESRYNSSSRIKELVTVWASHASMKQRAGRAGRVSAGNCWRLCSEEFATTQLLQHTVPEMARTPLDELVLQIGLLFEQRRDAVHDNGDSQLTFAQGFKPIKFLSMTPTPPAERSLMQACKHLLEVEALKITDYGSDGEDISCLYRLSPLGYHLSRLPMDGKVGKMLIIGCLLGCLDNALTIAASLSCPKSCFLQVSSCQNRHVNASSIEARDNLIETGFGGQDWQGGTVKGDLIAVIAVYRAWAKKKGRQQREKFCRDHALNSTTLCDMETLRRQFFDLLVDAGLVPANNDSSLDAEDDCNNASNEDALLTSCCLVGGLYPNICTLIRSSQSGPKSAGGRLLTNDNSTTCRPSSQSFQRMRVQKASKSGKDAYAVYHSKHRSLGTTSPGQRHPPETFLSEVNFVSKFALLLFGGELELVKNAIIIDKWLKFKVAGDDDSDKTAGKQNAILILSLRKLLDDVILEHVVETFASPEDKARMFQRHKRIIQVVRMILSDEG